VASILESGAVYDAAMAFYRARGSRVSAIREIVQVRVESAGPLDSPAYDSGMTEDEVHASWERHFDALRSRRASTRPSSND